MNLLGIEQYLVALFPSAIIILVFPMVLPGANFTAAQALLVVLVPAVTHGVLLLIQAETHQSLFIYEYEDEGDDDDPHHGKPSARSSMRHAAWLIIHLITVIAVIEISTNPLETLLTELDTPAALAGFLVTSLVLSPEGLGALKVVLSNRVQRAMNLLSGSVLTAISLTVPVVTLIVWATGNDLVPALGASGMTVMVSSLVLCRISSSTGCIDVFNGAARLALSIAYLMTMLT